MVNRYFAFVLVVVLLAFGSVVAVVLSATNIGTYSIALPLIAREDFPTAQRFLTFTQEDQIIVSRVDGQERYTLTQGSGEYSRPIWSPEGSYIAYEGVESDTQFLYISTPTGSESRVVGLGAGLPPRYSWSGDGHYLVYIPSVPSRPLLSFDVYSMETMTIAENVVGSVWLTEGKQLLYQQAVDDPDELVTDFYTFDFASGDHHYLVTSRDYNVNYYFSPVDSRIAFRVETNEPNIDELYVVNSDGSGQHELGRGVFSWREPHWSPDGAKFAYTLSQPATEEYDFNIFVANTDGSGVRQLTNARTVDQGLSWSLDSSRLAYYRPNASGTDGEIRVVNMDGTGDTLVLTVQGSTTTRWFKGGLLGAIEGSTLNIIPENTSPYIIHLPTCNTQSETCTMKPWSEIYPYQTILFEYVRNPASLPFVYQVYVFDLNRPNSYGEGIGDPGYYAATPVVSQDDLLVMFNQWFYEGSPRYLAVRDFLHQRNYHISELRDQDRAIPGTWAPLGYTLP